ncbi:MAG: hypothetical protein IPK52_10070 [Chloroflexi bacterium]|nr:hypothetical protein [Chloroflexota bacterium]
MTDKVMTLHPKGKLGVSIDHAKYEQMRDAIMNAVEVRGTTSFTEMIRMIHDAIDGEFDGSIEWYATTVKLDLEARGQLERVRVKGCDVYRIRA